MSWNPRPYYKNLVYRINDLLSQEKRPVRDIYYALESIGYNVPYNKVKYACKMGRTHKNDETGTFWINPERIIDVTRDAGKHIPYDGYENPQAFLDELKEIHTEYKENYWERDGVDHYVELWLEKRGLTPLFKPICEKYNIRLIPCGGDQSITEVFDASYRFLKRLFDPDTNNFFWPTDDGFVQCVVLYFGDFNPSGYHAPVAIQKTMQKFGVPQFRPDTEATYFEIDTGGIVKFRRIALILDQIKKFPELPVNPTPSATDKDKTLRDRFMMYVSEGRDINIELNALKEFHREYLEELIDKEIKRYVDEDKWNEHNEKVGNLQERLKDKISIEDWEEE